MDDRQRAANHCEEQLRCPVYLRVCVGVRFFERGFFKKKSLSILEKEKKKRFDQLLTPPQYMRISGVWKRGGEAN